MKNAKPKITLIFAILFDPKALLIVCHVMPKYLDLFSGCGGLSLGLSNAGFRGVAAIEANPDAFETYRTNLLSSNREAYAWPEWLDCKYNDIVEVVEKHAGDLTELHGEVDLLAGGPPCQGFSMNGRRDPSDPRNTLVKAYIRMVELIRPKIVLIENVRGFTSMPHSEGGTYNKFVENLLDGLGYNTWSDVLMASDWGVPQRRPRYICIAIQKKILSNINPLERLKVSRKKFLAARGLDGRPTTVGEAISDFIMKGNKRQRDPVWGSKGYFAVTRRDDVVLSSYQQLMRGSTIVQPEDRRLARHRDETVKKFSQILETCEKGRSLSPEDRKRLNIGKRSTTPLSAAMPSPTVTTLPDDMIHYKEPRTLSVREIARLQSFPDWFSFKGPYTTGGDRRKTACPRYTQVGNAVPPLLAEAIGEMLISLFREHEAFEAANSFEVIEKISSIPLEVANC